jgi:hypothetical protein
MSTEQAAARRDRTPYLYETVVVAVVLGVGLAAEVGKVGRATLLDEHVEVPEQVA